jgi:hypothetical protein
VSKGTDGARAPIADAQADKPIIAYKGFDKDFSCRGHKFEVGKTYEAKGKIKACENGFHACLNPFDVWDYYGLGGGNRFGLVEMSGKMATHDEDTKIAAAKITITAELTMPEFIKRGVEWLIEATKGKGSSGDSAKIGSSGDSAKIGSSGDYAQIGSSGGSAQIGSSGDYAKIDCSGENAVIASAGPAAVVRAKKGAWISVAEYVDGKCVGFATGCIGKDGIKADTWYRAEGGKLVEA